MNNYPEIFLRCLDVVLRAEGGYSNHPADPGKATMEGVTQAVYDSWRAKNGEPYQDVRLISDDELRDIYYTQYWLPSNVDLLNNPDLMLDLFDMSVNSGVRTACKILQRLVGAVDDGFIGEKTVEAVNNFKEDIVEEYKKRRKLFYVTLAQTKPSLRVFLKGWLARVDQCKFI